ncbi:MAG: transposase [Ardenticatenaceae bacterium]|nr:transposase [Ardenticatenaceae bacterium]
MSKARRPPYMPGHYYHIYNRGAHKASIFHEPTNYLFVIGQLKKYVQKYNISLIVYCLLPNHYHLLARQNNDMRVGLLAQHTFNSYSKAYNKRYSHSGTLFEGPFEIELIKQESHLRHLCRYIHANPVKHRIVSHPAEWPYSNYLDWVGARRGKLVVPEFVTSFFGSVEMYIRYVDEYLQRLGS